jgi:EmrB/QacA subfamily drug resistance transporter
MMMAALDMTIVSTAMPSIVSSLHGATLYSWIFSIYLLTSTTPIPLYGKLADMYGRKRLFIVGVVLFTVGSLLSAFSHTMMQLIIFRALQGLGAAGVLPIALTIVGDLFTLQQRARIQGILSATWGLSAIVGPLLGAFIVENMSWRWVFGINIPIGAAVLVILFTSFHEKVVLHPHHLDWFGTAALTSGITVFLIGLIQLSNQKSGEASLFEIAIGLLILAGFILWEKRVSEPILPLSLFQDRLLGMANAVNFLGGMILFGLISYVPLFVQGVLAQSPTQAGRAITPMMFGWPLAALFTGYLILRFGMRIVNIAGGVLIATGTILIAYSIHLSLWRIDLGMLIIGAGMGLTLTGLLLVVQNAVPWNQRGVVTGASQFFRTIGGTVGVALMGTLLNHTLSQQIARMPTHSASLSPSLVTDTLLSTSKIPVRQLDIFHSWLNLGLHHSLLALAFCGVLIALLVSLVPMKTVSSAETSDQETSVSVSS